MRSTTLVVAALAAVFLVSTTQAGLISQSAYSGPSVNGGPGLDLTDVSMVGQRFYSPDLFEIDEVGGVFRTEAGAAIFVAIVKLTGATDFPDSTDLSTSDRYAYSVFNLSSGPSVEKVLDNFDGIPLAAGHYAVIFGTSPDFFGAGQAIMPTAFAATSSPELIAYDATNGWHNVAPVDDETARIFVSTTTIDAPLPEPSSLALLVIAGLVMGVTRLKRPRR